MTAELSFKKNLCKYLGMNADKQANALAGKKPRKLAKLYKKKSTQKAIQDKI